MTFTLTQRSSSLLYFSLSQLQAHSRPRPFLTSPQIQSWRPPLLQSRPHQPWSLGRLRGKKPPVVPTSRSTAWTASSGKASQAPPPTQALALPHPPVPPLILWCIVRYLESCNIPSTTKRKCASSSSCTASSASDDDKQRTSTVSVGAKKGKGLVHALLPLPSHGPLALCLYPSATGAPTLLCLAPLPASRSPDSSLLSTHPHQGFLF